MHIEELNQETACERGEERLCREFSRGAIVVSDAKRVLVGAGARALFYPTLLYNVVRNKIQSEFRWWDRVDKFILLGAVPFPADVPRLKELGVGGVVTLNEPYETLVPTSLYHDYDINHLVIPTRDYLFAPSYGDIRQAVNFIHENASCGKATYVHCKAGRGRSTTIVLCYLVEHKQMSPECAYEYVRSIRPRVLLARSQWQAVKEYYSYRVKNSEKDAVVCSSGVKSVDFSEEYDLSAFDDGSVVVVTDSDLDGYDSSYEYNSVGNDMLAEASLACRVQFASQAAIARLSCLWLRGRADGKISSTKLSSLGTDQLGSVGVDIRVY